MLIWCHLSIHFQKFIHGFQVGPKFGYKFWYFKKVFKIDKGEEFGKLYVQSGDKFQCADNWRRFGCIPSDKNKFNICWNQWFVHPLFCILVPVFWSLCVGFCILVIVFWLLLKSLGAPWSYFSLLCFWGCWCGTGSQSTRSTCMWHMFGTQIIFLSEWQWSCDNFPISSFRKRCSHNGHIFFFSMFTFHFQLLWHVLCKVQVPNVDTEKNTMISGVVVVGSPKYHMKFWQHKKYPSWQKCHRFSSCQSLQQLFPLYWSLLVKEPNLFSSKRIFQWLVFIAKTLLGPKQNFFNWQGGFQGFVFPEIPSVEPQHHIIYCWHNFLWCCICEKLLFRT